MRTIEPTSGGYRYVFSSTLSIGEPSSLKSSHSRCPTRPCSRSLPRRSWPRPGWGSRAAPETSATADRATRRARKSDLLPPASRLPITPRSAAGTRRRTPDRRLDRLKRTAAGRSCRSCRPRRAAGCGAASSRPPAAWARRPGPPPPRAPTAPSASAPATRPPPSTRAADRKQSASDPDPARMASWLLTRRRKSSGSVSRCRSSTSPRSFQVLSRSQQSLAALSHCSPSIRRPTRERSSRAAQSHDSRIWWDGDERLALAVPRGPGLRRASPQRVELRGPDHEVVLESGLSRQVGLAEAEGEAAPPHLALDLVGDGGRRVLGLVPRGQAREQARLARAAHHGARPGQLPHLLRAPLPGEHPLRRAQPRHGRAAPLLLLSQSAATSSIWRAARDSRRRRHSRWLA
uniref:Uncharacterized protein n=1 Tax=Ananas comosus var. bracteatus TaxID=296719 RepID=A0A6V7NGK6_ANACO|nr:unnamed protein product [Ananas comosus var. bracteatus]